MAAFKQFKDIEVWQLAREFARKIWDVSNSNTFKDDYSLKNQINAAAGSVMDNIAEGFGRGGNREFVNFLSYARGSNDEVRSQLHRAADRLHITQRQLEELELSAKKIGTKISNLISYLLQSNQKGQKFR